MVHLIMFLMVSPWLYNSISRELYENVYKMRVLMIKTHKPLTQFSETNFYKYSKHFLLLQTLLYR